MFKLINSSRSYSIIQNPSIFGRLISYQTTAQNEKITSLPDIAIDYTGNRVQQTNSFSYGNKTGFY